MSIAAFVPASLLLDEEEEALFLEWQGSRVKPDQRGQIRNAEEYCRFMQACEEEVPISVASPHAAFQCGHTLHPSVHIVPLYCPVCEVSMSLVFLDAIARAFDDAGGPWHTSTHIDPDMPTIHECWHMARLQLQEVVEFLEVLAEYETEWELRHPNDTAATHTNTAKKALRLATFKHKYPAAISGAENTGTKRKAADPGEAAPQRKKTVTFAPDTKFGRGRSSSTYSRSSKQYRPGEHACDNEDGWLNTSQCDLTEADFQNLKLFSTESLEEFGRFNDDIPCRPGEYQGLLGTHSAFDSILTLVSADNGPTVDELVTAVRQTDAIIVLLDGDKALDFHLSHSVDVEDIDDPVAEDQSRWTCLRDIVSTRKLKVSVDAVASDETAEVLPQRKQRKVDHDLVDPALRDLA